MFLSFSEFNDLYWPTNFLSLSDRSHGRTQETKKVGNIFCNSNFGNFLFKFFNFEFYDLITNKEN